MIEQKNIEEQINRSELPEKIELRLKLAYETRLSDPQKSSEQAITAYNEAVKIKDAQLELNALNSLCTSALYNTKLKNPQKWIDLLTQRGIQLENNLAIGRSYLYKYRWVIRTGKLTEAAQLLHKALEFLNENEHTREISSCYTGLGNVHFKLKNYDKAYDHFLRAYQFVKDDAKSEKFMIMQNIAATHCIREEYNEAWKVFHDILDELPGSEIATKRLVIQNLGNLCQRTGELEEALTYFKKAEELSYYADSDIDIIRPLCNQAGILTEMKQFDQALNTYKRAEKIVLNSNNLEKQSEVFSGMVDFYRKTNDLHHLVEYQDKLIKTNEFLHKSSNLNSINEFESDHQINLYKDKSLLLDRKNQLISLQNKNLMNSMNELISKNKDLEIKLINAFSTIKEKDNVITAHHRLASVGEMVAIIAHQWQQPLSIINTIMFSIKDAYSFDELTSEMLEEKSGMINELIDYLAQTINDFRNFFKEQPQIDFAASESINNTLHLLEYVLQKENVNVRIYLHDDFIITGTPNELSQVFLNIINNARDAFKEEDTLQPQLIIKLTRKPDGNYISFYNNGGSIPDELGDSLFEPYVSSKGDNGTGLGLNICKTIIEDRFNAKIWFENTVDGVSFIIKFPDPA